MSDSEATQPQPTPAKRVIRSLGNHLTLIETHAAQCRRQIAELALTIGDRD